MVVAHHDERTRVGVQKTRQRLRYVNGIFCPPVSLSRHTAGSGSDGTTTGFVKEPMVVAHHDERTRVGVQKTRQRLLGVQVEVVRRLIEHDELGFAQQSQAQRELLRLPGAQRLARHQPVGVGVELSVGGEHTWAFRIAEPLQLGQQTRLLVFAGNLVDDQRGQLCVE